MEFRVKPAARLVSSIPKPYKEAKSGWVHLAAPKMAENPWVENLGECQVWFGQVGSVGWWGRGHSVQMSRGCEFGSLTQKQINMFANPAGFRSFGVVQQRKPFNFKPSAPALLPLMCARTPTMHQHFQPKI